MEKTKKELALVLIESLKFVAAEDDKEMTKLRRESNPRFNPVGESSMSHHLKILQELVEGI